jgi:hypothetical protein
MDEKETGRLEAFSDGVFAVAITLLVLNIKIPGLDLPLSQLAGDKRLPGILDAYRCHFLFPACPVLCAAGPQSTIDAYNSCAG